MGITLKDVAQETGFCIQTVSDVLNCHDPRYSEATRRKIRKAADQLEYQPDRMAQAMVRGRTQTIGMVATNLTTPVTMEKIEAICHQAWRMEYQVYLAAKENEEAGLRIMRDFLGRRVEGLICFTGFGYDPAPYRELIRKGVPTVLIGGLEESKGLPVVDVDAAEGLFQTTCHLLELGHRDIAFLPGRYLASFAHGRMAGYRRALKARRVPIRENLILVDRDITPKEVYRQTKRLMKLARPPTAIIYSNDQMALIGMHALWAEGYQVPGDVSVAGYDDLPFAEFLHPALTTVRQPRGEFAQVVLDLLMKQIHGGKAALQPRLLKPELMLRPSTGPARV
ncbi:MAG: LacI family DNA-binding transcriptional regulator [Verrucomicrobia bacterium]|nr:LacI family DNA-binding transcriptional regulator [Verrucomicrobiota bacterium]